jgi:hypothetical protein
MKKVSKEFIAALNGILNGESWRRSKLKKYGETYRVNSVGNISCGSWSNFPTRADLQAKDWVKVQEDKDA